MIQRELLKEIEVVFEKHYHEFCLLSYSYTGCQSKAQDIVQDVFVKILLKEDSVKIVNLKAYIWISVKNTSLKGLRNSGKTESLDKLESLMEEESEVNDELDSRLRSAMDKLPPKCRSVFELCVVEGYRYATAADSLGISINTVKTQMNKAYKILRSDLADIYIVLLILGQIH